MCPRSKTLQQSTLLLAAFCLLAAILSAATAGLFLANAEPIHVRMRTDARHERQVAEGQRNVVPWPCREAGYVPAWLWQPHADAG